MDDATVGLAKKSCADEADSERVTRLRERLERSLREAAEIEVELSRADGSLRGVPHDSVIEGGRTNWASSSAGRCSSGR